MFYSDCRQDEFAANILGFKKDGFYIDIGAAGPVSSNNSYLFERLGWKGLCVESNPHYFPQWGVRNALFLGEDALKIDYKKVFEENGFPQDIDYASIDIDTLSYDALLSLPLEDYKFKVITIEHDAYLYGDKYKSKQKELLLSKGYELLCENVYVEMAGHGRPESSFEDWYVYPSFFSKDLISKIKCKDIYPSAVIQKFNEV
jgi:hypothetical protein